MKKQVQVSKQFTIELEETAETVATKIETGTIKNYESVIVVNCRIGGFNII